MLDRYRSSSFLFGGFTIVMVLMLKSQVSETSFSSTMISSTVDDVMNAGPGALQVEHTSHRLCLTWSHSSTKTPPAQGLCSNSTAEMLLPARDVRFTAQGCVVTGSVPWCPGRETTSNRCPSSIVKVSSEALPVEQFVCACSELCRGFPVTSSVNEDSHKMN